MSSKNGQFYEFGGFRLNAEHPSLWFNDKLVQLPPKALELLILLVERRGEIVSREELLETVWRETFVEESNINYTVSLLRKTLSERDKAAFIQTVPKRGYRFVAPVRSIKKPIERANSNRKEILLATQIQTHILTEEIIEEDEADEPKLLPAKTAPWKQAALWIGAAMVLLAAVGFLGFWYLRPKTNSIANIKFQKLTDTGDIFFPVISPDGNFAAYSKVESAFVQDIQSGSVVELKIPGIKKYGYLQFSPDSNSLYFRNQSSIFIPSDILQIPRLGGAHRLVAQNVWSNFSFSHDGKLLAFVRVFPNENKQALIIKNLETGRERELTGRHAPEQFYVRAFPAWSPEGSRITLIIQKQRSQFLKVVSVELEDGREEEVKTGDLKGVEQIVWNPDCDGFIASARENQRFQLWKIYYPSGDVEPITNDLSSHRFLSISADGKKLLTMQVFFYSNIWTADANFNNQKQLTFGTSKNDGFFGIDRLDNDRIVYASNEGESLEWNLWIVDTKDGSRRQLTSGSRNDFPTVSADNKFIYFNSNRSGQIHIWRIGTGGENLMQITSGENESHLYPQLSPDDAWLYYIKKTQKNSAIWRKSLTHGKEEKLTDERKISPSNFLAISPDGKLLVTQNLTEKLVSEATNQTYQIAVISAENPQDLRFFDISGGKVEVYWTPDSKAIEYHSFSPEGAKLWRLNLEDKSAPKPVAFFSRERLFYVDWSKDGKTIAFSRGQQLHDAVILTNFQP
ncbi:MAG: winged helix-turn-helix domain-containing protein [Acidobacteriota bacterium]|nr:winged helix-turn-helix domain-containing protein [Acidobacteriota bacterium]